ncbi:hypothetical protein [Enterocloster lavalensis]|uniref:Uncharacterized protein n=1 Tax=Enterocloster lavalensis TaxID=460384 RepID=A0A1I0KA66_9FIRM|nr:hypothetical protein [Enterocloster lavalensis]SEU20813.1 hypothetical protein SAMN05216313_1571 [Enterocloster lavalensis]
MAEYNKQYTPTLWKNYPLTDTSINAYRLNHLEGGVNENDNRLVALSEDKAEQAVVNKMVKTVTLNKDTGVLTVTLLDGTKTTYDLDVEKVVANFDLNSNNDLVLTLADGTQKVVPLSKFVDTYTFKSSGTITFNTNGKEITAFVPDGSITLAKLEATVLSTIRQYMLDAQTAKGQAEQAAENARGYAVGGTGFEGVSAQHFANLAKRYAVITDEAPKDNAQSYAQDAAKSAEEARQAAGCDGTAASISAVDVQGLVAAAGGNSDVQALINAVADRVINRLVAKGQIVNNLLATEPGNVLDATQGKALKEYYDRLNSDLDEHFMMSPDGVTAIQSKSGNTWRRLQVQMINDDIALFKSHDGGATWPEVKTLLTNADFRTSGVKLAEIFYDPLASSAVIKWTLSDNLIYQMVITDQGLRYDRWNGLTWENMWAK